MDSISDLSQTFGAVIDSIHCSNVGKESLSCANVGGGFVTTDVLFTGLESHTESRLSLGITGNTDDATRQETLVFVVASKESSVRATIAERDAETLGRADDDVCAPFTGRCELGEGEEVGGGDNLDLGSVCLFGECLYIE